jgi:hypothetical protein
MSHGYLNEIKKPSKSLYKQLDIWYAKKIFFTFVFSLPRRELLLLSRLIAKSLTISEQLLHYYTNQLITVKLIEKCTTDNVLVWKLTKLGEFTLKEHLSRTVNNNNNNKTALHNLIPVRIDNITFSFAILSLDENIRLRWKPIKHGVSKCFTKYSNYILELTKSPNVGESVLEVHLSHAYTFDPVVYPYLQP